MPPALTLLPAHTSVFLPNLLEKLPLERKPSSLRYILIWLPLTFLLLEFRSQSSWVTLFFIMDFWAPKPTFVCHNGLITYQNFQVQY